MQGRVPAGEERPPAGRRGPPRRRVHPSHGRRPTPSWAGPARPAALARRTGPGRPALTSRSSAAPPRPARVMVRRWLPGDRPRPPPPRAPSLPCPPGPAALTPSLRACAAAGREEGGGEKPLNPRLRAWSENEAGVVSCCGRGLITGRGLGEAHRVSRPPPPHSSLCAQGSPTRRVPEGRL